MPGLQVHTGKTAVYNVDNVDTDRIIPARFLTRVQRSGYGDLLFVDTRRNDPDFPLDQSEAKGASVLIVGTNFGCGSSREHAVWAIQQAGFKVVVARKTPETPGYSDIFRQNAANCGLLLVEIEDAPHQDLASKGSGTEVTIDLPAQSLSWPGGDATFDIDALSKDQVVRGLDLIGSTLDDADAIAAFEKKWHSFAPPAAIR